MMIVIYWDNIRGKLFYQALGKDYSMEYKNLSENVGLLLLSLVLLLLLLHFIHFSEIKWQGGYITCPVFIC